MFYKRLSLLLAFCCYFVYAETYSLETQANAIAKTDAEIITELIQMNFKKEIGKEN